MQIIIIRNTIIENPGIIVGDKVKIFPKPEILDLVVPFRFLKKQVDLLKPSFKIENLQKTISEHDSFLSKITPNAILVSKKTIKEQRINYNQDFYFGLFKDREHYNFIIDKLPADDSLVFITSIDDVNQHYNETIQGTGIYIYNNDKLYLASSFSITAWEEFISGIVQVFSNLGASSIEISDNTSINSDIDLDIKIKKFSSKIGIKLDTKSSFNFKCKLKSKINKNKARLYLNSLNKIELLKELAIKQLEDAGSIKSFDNKVSFDISFGLDIEILSAFQGTFEGGYKRDLHFIVEF